MKGESPALCDFCFPIKGGFLNVSPFKADMNCFYLDTFYSVLTFLYFCAIASFCSHSRHYYCDCFYYYCFCHCHCHYHFFIFSAFNFYFSSFCHPILSLYISSIFTVYLTYSSDNLLSRWYYYILPLTIILWVNSDLLCCWVICIFVCNLITH